MLEKALRMVGEVVLETLWPTRCAVCDQPGSDVICKSCDRQLPVVDSCKACPICGAPYGIVQCTECNDVMLRALSLRALPMESMSHALLADDDVVGIVKAYKDGDERRLADFIARRIAGVVSPERQREGCPITYIPDTSAARRRRGFDHGQEIAEAVAKLLGLECLRLFATPKGMDQRHLDKRARIENMRGTMQLEGCIQVPESVLVVDDICTTGATAFAAALALREAGVRKVHVATFAKVQ